MRRTFQWIRANITGISTPLLGISWQPTPTEKEAIRKFLVFLEDRRALHLDENGRSPHVKSHNDHPEWLRESLLEIRRMATVTMQSTVLPEEIAKLLRGIQGACRDRLEAPGILVRTDGRHTPYCSASLKRLHQEVGIAIAGLAAAYEIDLEINLSVLVEAAAT